VEKLLIFNPKTLECMIDSHGRSMKIFSIVIKMLSIRKISQNVLPLNIGKALTSEL
jgi:hypothetical protein